MESDVDSFDLEQAIVEAIPEVQVVERIQDHFVISCNSGGAGGGAAASVEEGSMAIGVAEDRAWTESSSVPAC